MRADAKKNYDLLIAVARDLIAEYGAGVSLRDVARRAGVGLGTLYRHFPTRDALLEALLRAGFDELIAKAERFENSSSAGDALMSWMRDAVAGSHNYRGVVTAMMAAIKDPDSALHNSCVRMRAAGARLLARAQAEGTARADVNGSDLFALIGALAWLRNQAAIAPRADHLFDVMASAILANRPESQKKHDCLGPHTRASRK